MGWANARGRPAREDAHRGERVGGGGGLVGPELRQGARLGEVGGLEDRQRPREAPGRGRQPAQADQHPPAHRTAAEALDERDGRLGRRDASLAKPRHDLADEEREAAGRPVAGVRERRLGGRAELPRQQLGDPAPASAAPE